MTDYQVILESAWYIRDVQSIDDAIGIAISEAGKRLNPTAKFVDVETGFLSCPYCSEELPAGLLIANTAFVGLRMEMKVFNAESEDHAGKIARKTIGRALQNIPLDVIEVNELSKREK
ncbi:MAG: DUF555 domain-containing protein [Methanomicrobiales archaeon]|jgi:uncharacterized protein (UPF0212 family)|nr:DUF555 domain-containing protein [Methanomicrobiales archaeon]